MTASSTLTAGQQLCVKDDAGEPVCVTGSQLRSLLNGAGSVLGTSTHDEHEKAAGMSGSGETNAPSASSIENGEKTMDTATTTMPVGSPEEEGHDDENHGADSEDSNAPENDVEPPVHDPAPSGVPANDTSPTPEVPAAGTE